MPGGLSPLALLLIGFIIGWIVEWLIDLWLRQGRTDARMAQLEEVLREKDARLVEALERAQVAEARLAELKARPGEEELAAPEITLEEVPGLVSPPEIETIAHEVSVPGVEVEAPGIETGTRGIPSPVEQGDDLASIPGLGPAYACLLKEAGVLTYEDLARLDEPDLRTLVRARPSWEGVDVGAWIAEARRRAGLEEVVTVIEPPEFQSSEPVAEAAPAREIPEEAGEETARDDLTKIKGIGPAYARKLHSAGIYDFRGLAALSEDELRNIIQPQSWQKVNLSSWIEQARALTTRE